VKYLLFLSTLFAFGANATTYTGTIGKIYMGPAYGSSVLVLMPRNAVPSPSCSGATSSDYGFYFDADTPSGKLLASAVLAAYVSKSSVVIQGGGPGSCSASPSFPGAESITLFRME
jgi:hypothetical protein